ncbi:condensation domain-containing protein [Okeania sp.]|uniref:condensation domain-containing protein n=1 Tax=Okeania sp. TaxID=3100323 RepID=UPI002B4B07F1|nr:condensation domain-containing protein [Okeania sp.]MEB3341935.1 condensation domain-containing protein [Okeania sp.]
MKLTEILSQISSQGIKLWAEGDELKIRAPKGALTTETRDLLSKNKLELLHLLQEKSSNVSATSVPLVYVGRDKDLPVTYQQERLWTIDQLMGNKLNLNVSTALKIEGLIDIPLLQKSWNEIISRNESLRTIFSFAEGSLIQVIVPSLDSKISVIDYQGLSKTEQERAISEIIEKEAEQYLDLSQGPLVHLKLLRCSETEGVLILVSHHIISDGLSHNFIFREHILLYDSYLSQKPSPLPELDIQYGDYSVWQRQLLQGEVLQKGIDFWKQELANISTLYPVPSDIFQVSPGFKAIKKNFSISMTTWPLIQKVSNQYSVTPVVIFLSVFYVLVFQYSLKQDIVVGLPVSGRLHHKLESAIGYFTDSILLRGKIPDSSITFKELLKKVKEVTIKAYANQHIPLNFVSEFLNKQNNQQYRNLFQIFFDYIDFGGKEKIESPNMTGTILEEKFPTDIDLFFLLLKYEHELKGSFAYNPDLFEEETITGFIDSFLLLLEKAINAPETKINDLEISENLAKRKTEIHSQSRKINLIETALKSIPEVKESAILNRDNQLVAYLVIEDNYSVEKVKYFLESYLDSDFLPKAYVPVSSLPKTESGEIDEAVLTSLEVIDSELINLWEQKLRSHPEIEEVAVVVQRKEAYPVIESRGLETKPYLVSKPYPGTPDYPIQLTQENIPDTAPGEVDEIAASVEFKTWADLLPGTDEPAIYSTDGRQPLTHSQLKDFVKCPPDNASLSYLGIKITDRVCAAMDNGPEAATAFLSLAQQCVFAPISTSLTEKQVQFELEDLGAVALVLQRGEANSRENAKLKACAESLGVRVIELIPDASVCGLFTLEEVTTNQENHQPITAEDNKPTRDHVALVLHTSGTTRKPKTVPLTHGNLTAGSLTISRTIQLTPEDTCINIMPLFHIHGLSVNILASMLAGASVLCTPGLYATENGVGDFFKWLKPDEIGEGKKITWYSAVPTMHQAILEYAEQTITEIGKAPDHSLRLIRNCSAALLPAIVDRMATAFNCEVLPTYAMTESMPICSPEVGKGLLKRGSVGRAAGPKVIIGDVKTNGQGKPVLNVLEPYAEGEVMVRGACVTAGYELREWMDYNPNEEAFIDGWLRTGDKGYKDEDGYVYLVGRFKEIINRAGEKISPMVVEDVLQRHPAVGQVVVFAAPHELLGEVVGAAIVPVPNQPRPTLAALRQFAMKEKELETQWLPECLVWMSAIPKGLTGKPARIGLAKRLELPTLTTDVTKSPRTFVATEGADGKYVLETLEHQIENGKGGCQSLQQLTVYFTSKTTEFSLSKLEGLEVSDRFGTLSKILPSAFVQLERLPLTSDGKLDRKRLQSHEKNGSSPTVQQGNKTEQKIVAIWKEVLQIEEVGIYDNFFELGGKSVLLIQVYGKLQEIFDMSNLKVVDLLANPTVHSLSEFIVSGGATELDKKIKVSYEKRVSKRLSKKNERVNMRKKLRANR